MAEIHLKLYLHGYKGALKEVRRLGVHADADWAEWANAHKAVHSLFALEDAIITYEDPEHDRISLGSQLEWLECLRLGPYTVHNPLRLFVKKQYPKVARHFPDPEGVHQPPEQPQSVQPTLEPVHVYTTSGDVNHEEAERAKETIPAIIERHAPLPDIPEWMHPALQHLPGGVDIDVNVDHLAACLNSQALKLMSLEHPKYPDALELLKDACIIKPGNTQTLYNIACCHALLGHTEEALGALEAAVDRGFENYEHMMQDEDLRSLRDEERFQALASRLQPASSSVQDMEEDTLAEVPASVAVIEESGAAVPAPPEPSQVILDETLDQLRAMGFEDDAIRQALEQSRGSLPGAIEKLLL